MVFLMGPHPPTSILYQPLRLGSPPFCHFPRRDSRVSPWGGTQPAPDGADAESWVSPPWRSANGNGMPPAPFRRTLVLLSLASLGWAVSFGLGAPLASLWLRDAGHGGGAIGLNTSFYYLGIAL